MFQDDTFFSDCGSCFFLQRKYVGDPCCGGSTKPQRWTPKNRSGWWMLMVQILSLQDCFTNRNWLIDKLDSGKSPFRGFSPWITGETNPINWCRDLPGPLFINPSWRNPHWAAENLMGKATFQWKLLIFKIWKSPKIIRLVISCYISHLPWNIPIVSLIFFSVYPMKYPIYIIPLTRVLSSRSWKIPAYHDSNDLSLWKPHFSCNVHGDVMGFRPTPASNRTISRLRWQWPHLNLRTKKNMGRSLEDRIYLWKIGVYMYVCIYILIYLYIHTYLITIKVGWFCDLWNV